MEWRYPMEWDLGLQGLGVLVLMAVGLGLIVQLLAGRDSNRWLWLITAGIYFVGGLFTSEVWFGWATEEELQPNIDGLSFDEVLLFGMVLGAVIVTVSRRLGHRKRDMAREPTRDEQRSSVG